MSSSGVPNEVLRRRAALEGGGCAGLRGLLAGLFVTEEVAVAFEVVTVVDVAVVVMERLVVVGGEVEGIDPVLLLSGEADGDEVVGDVCSTAMAEPPPVVFRVAVPDFVRVRGNESSPAGRCPRPEELVDVVSEEEALSVSNDRVTIIEPDRGGGRTGTSPLPLPRLFDFLETSSTEDIQAFVNVGSDSSE